MATPPPLGVPIEEKRVFFITHHPDSGEVIAHEIPQEEVLNAELVEKKKSVSQQENNDTG